jgi:hypothetical protein
MFRRRPLRPRIPRPIGPRRHPALQRLQRAHQLMSEGSFTEAGQLFEELAVGAETRGIPRAPQLFLLAGHAFVNTEDSEHGIELLKRGLQLMGRMGQLRRLPAASQRVLNELQTLSLEEERASLEEEINQILTQWGVELSAPSRGEKPHLPGKCPQCGGTVHPQEVEWIDERSASCDYCGSILEAI